MQPDHSVCLSSKITEFILITVKCISLDGRCSKLCLSHRTARCRCRLHVLLRQPVGDKHLLGRGLLGSKRQRSHVTAVIYVEKNVFCNGFIYFCFLQTKNMWAGASLEEMGNRSLCCNSSSLPLHSADIHQSEFQDSTLHIIAVAIFCIALHFYCKILHCIDCNELRNTL